MQKMGNLNSRNVSDIRSHNTKHSNENKCLQKVLQLISKLPLIITAAMNKFPTFKLGTSMIKDSVLADLYLLFQKLAYLCNI
jgi:hypothetical protein